MKNIINYIPQSFTEDEFFYNDFKYLQQEITDKKKMHELEKAIYNSDILLATKLIEETWILYKNIIHDVCFILDSSHAKKIKFLKYLIERGAKLKGDIYNTIIHKLILNNDICDLCEYETLDIISYLVANGTPFLTEDDNEYNPITIAIKLSKFKIATYLSKMINRKDDKYVLEMNSDWERF